MMNKELYEIIFWLGYIPVIGCQVPQVWRMLKGRTVAGVSGWMYAALVPGLALLQAASIGLKQHPAFITCNAVALAIAILGGLVYWRISAAEKRYALTPAGRDALERHKAFR
jgi:hypothetical protein